MIVVQQCTGGTMNIITHPGFRGPTTLLVYVYAITGCSHLLNILRYFSPRKSLCRENAYRPASVDCLYAPCRYKTCLVTRVGGTGACSRLRGGFERTPRTSPGYSHDCCSTCSQLNYRTYNYLALSSGYSFKLH